MRHLVAYFGNEPENLACALFSARAALYVRGEARTVEGYGLGFVQGGDVLLQKRPRAETVEVDLYNLVKDTRAEALIGRVGLAHDGSTPAEDADPFRFRSWLFGSIAELPDATFETIRDKMLEKTPAFLRRNIRGKASSEHLFHLFLAFLHDAGILDQPTPAPAAVHAALRNSLTLVDGLLAEVEAAPLQIALAATNGRCFVATGCALSDPLPRHRGDHRLSRLSGQARRRPQRTSRPARGAAGAGRRGGPRRGEAGRLARGPQSIGVDRRSGSRAASPAALSACDPH